MWKLHSYYLRELGGTAALTFLVMFSIVLCGTLYRGIEMAQGGDLVAAMLATFFWTADTFPHLLAISLLVATVMVFARASQDREITAVRAAGISPRVPMVSALLIGIALAVVGSYAHHYLIPWAHYHKYRVVGEAIRSFVESSGMGGYKLARPGFFMSWRSRDEQGRFHDVVLKVGSSSRAADDELDPGRAYVAEQASLDVVGDGEELLLRLHAVRDAATGTEFLGRVEIGVNLRHLGERGRRKESDKDLTTDQLLGEVLRGRHPNPGGARFTVHQRSCFAIMPALFAPIGFCIGVLSRDRGRMTAMLFGLVPLLVFYGCVLVSPTLVRTLDWPPVAWLPAVVVGALGLPFCWRLLRV